jgi:hypothetical protein
MVYASAMPQRLSLILKSACKGGAR